MTAPHHSASSVKVIHTLGPTGTNCEAAAHRWFQDKRLPGEVLLHSSLEEAAASLGERDDSALLGCIVYPDLHTLVFSNLEALSLVDLFIMPTHNMILASRTGEMPGVASSHPAPQGLVPNGVEVRLVNSNAQAALDCAAGVTDGWITTSVAADLADLKPVKDFGPVPMGFTLHRPRQPSRCKMDQAGVDAKERRLETPDHAAA